MIRLLPKRMNMIKKITFLIALLFLFVGVSGYFLMTHYENKLIKSQSIGVAEIVAQQAITARFAYATKILGISRVNESKVVASDEDFHKKVGTLPTPAAFWKGMVALASETSGGLYQYRIVSKWNLSPDQGLNNEFLRSAWAELEKQDQLDPKQAIEWKSFSKVQEYDGKETLLYLRPDPAAANSCVSCHNIYEKRPEIIERRIQQAITPGKVFKLHQLMGAIFVKIPIAEMQATAASQSRFVILWILGTLAFGLVGLALFFSRDLIQSRGIKRQLLWQTNHDALTRLPNRISFEKKAETLIKDAAANNNTHALCYLDLDQFKLVNDTSGYAAGDELLCKISNSLAELLESKDFLARLGGDEFGVLLFNCDSERATQVAHRLGEIVKDFNFTKEDHIFDIGVSIGLVVIDQDSTRVEKLMRQADLACYIAKDLGKNRVQIYKESNEVLTLRQGEAAWVSEVLKALNEDRVLIYSQRISAISSVTEHRHHEILVRLIDRQENIILPSHFVPAAERYQLMPKLDLAIIERSFSALRSGYFSDLGKDGFISVNLSGQSLSDADFLTKVKNLMLRHEVNPNQICFEITESAAIANQVLVKQFIIDMKRSGVRFALDDFGTGLSSLTYLKEFPVDYLKIDGSFIKDIVTNSIDRSLVDSINQMAQNLGMKTIAEYVESKEIFDLLGSMNIDYAQGYYIQKPVLVDVDKAA